MFWKKKISTLDKLHAINRKEMCISIDMWISGQTDIKRLDEWHVYRETFEEAVDVAYERIVLPPKPKKCHACGKEASNGNAE